MNQAKNNPVPEYDVEAIKRYMKLSAKEKLEYLEALNRFLSAATPPENKKIWQKLKKSGW